MRTSPEAKHSPLSARHGATVQPLWPPWSAVNEERMPRETLSRRGDLAAHGVGTAPIIAHGKTTPIDELRTVRGEPAVEAHSEA